MIKLKVIKFVTLTILINNFFILNTIASEKKSISEASEQLMRAIDSGNYEKVKVAIENGANVNIQDGNGETPLIKAAGTRDSKFIKLLLDSKADVNKETEYGETALHKASANNKIDNIKLLILAGADVNKQDQARYTPLLRYLVLVPRHITSKLDLDVIEMFLDYGADLALRSKFNDDPIGVVAGYAEFETGNMAEVLKLLQEHQEKQRQKVQEEVSKHLAPPGLADIACEYVFGPKK